MRSWLALLCSLLNKFNDPILEHGGSNDDDGGWQFCLEIAFVIHMYHYICVLKYHFNLQTETKFDFRLVWQKLEKQLTALSWLYKKRKQGKTTNIRLSQTRLCTTHLTHQNLPPTQTAQLWNRVPGPGFLFLFSILVVIQKKQNRWWHRTPHLSKFPPKQQCTHNLILQRTTSQIRSSLMTPTPLFKTRTDPLQHFKTTLFEIVATILQIYTVLQ